MKGFSRKAYKNLKTAGKFHQRDGKYKKESNQKHRKTMVTDIMIAFDRVISRLVINMERIREFENRSIEITQSETQREE